MGLLDLVSVPAGSDRKLAKFFLRPIDGNTGRPVTLMKAMRLQYWPETISWSRGTIGWQPREIPGLSHSLVSWSGNGSPTLSFDMVLVNERDPAYRPRTLSGSWVASDGGEYPRDANITAGIAWLAACSNPLYSGLSSEIPVQPPPLIQIIPQSLPPTGSQTVESIAVGQNRPFSGDPRTDLASDIGVVHRFSNMPSIDFIGVMTDFSVSYEKWFPSGAPRVVSISLSFMEVIQIGGVILPHSRGANMEIAKNYNLLESIGGA